MNNIKILFSIFSLIMLINFSNAFDEQELAKKYIEHFNDVLDEIIETFQKKNIGLI